MTRALVLVCALCWVGCDEPPPPPEPPSVQDAIRRMEERARAEAEARPPGATGQAAAARDLPAAPPGESLHGFPVHPGLVPVCQQEIVLSQGILNFAILASSLTPDELGAWYAERLPAGALDRSGGSWMWRLPEGAPPVRVLDVYDRARTDVPSCEEPIPEGAKTLVNYSEVARTGE